MNGWVISGIVLVFLGVMASVALSMCDMRRERAGLLKRIDGLNANILTLANERDAWKSHAHEAETERNELREQVGGLRLERDEALRPKVPPSDGTKKRIKGKPNSMEPPSKE